MIAVIIILLLILISLVTYLIISNQKKPPTRIIIHHHEKTERPPVQPPSKPRTDYVPIHIKAQREKYPNNPLCPKCGIPMLLYRRVEIDGSPTLWQCTKCPETLDINQAS
ncbi:hypothetical protein M2447_001311 [Ereboglobus sp. PH5-10]|uniref:hypothetical protein n=1 Tax=Ereboglobus sp. PH5-10 TaxID=2940629 RepID=UPI00240577CA|nr:hypothetical protein [Ereboglobus sp. PH5-10]MDF9827222.1 hypothetical protein [Ereboglobus sp. PH5-10]